MFENPVATYPDVFLHELVHGWQTQHSSMPPTVLVGVLADQLRGSKPYDYPAAVPAHKDFNLEQQAQVDVQEWWSGVNNHELSPRGNTHPAKWQ